jgi:hypothetical protein
MSVGARAGKSKSTDFFGPSRNAGSDETSNPFVRLAPSDENLAMTERFNAALKTTTHKGNGSHDGLPPISCRYVGI